MWHLILSNTKSKVLIFNKQYSQIRSHEFMYGISQIDITDCYKYLGFVLTTQSHNLFKSMYNHLVEQANKAKFAMYKSTTSSVGTLTPKVAFKVFDAQILPILEYGCPLWFTGKEIPVIETFHLKYMKSTLGVKKQSPSLGVYGDTGRFPLLYRQIYLAVKYWYRIQDLPSESLICKSYTCLVNLHDSGLKNWYSTVKYIIDKYCSMDMETCLTEKNVIKEKIFQYGKQMWKENMEKLDETNKLRTYKLYKNVLCMEPYLLNLKCIKSIKAIARFRLSSHRFHIEYGRYTKPVTPVENRICNNCTFNCTEDEIHVLIECTKYTSQRDELFNIANRIISNFSSLDRNNKFINILQCRDPTFIKEVSKFMVVCTCMKQNSL